MHQLKRAAGGFGGDVDAGQGAEAQAVHIGEIAQIEHHVFGAVEISADGGVENIRDAGDEFAVALDGDYIAGAVDVERERWRGGFSGHCGFLEKMCFVESRYAGFSHMAIGNGTTKMRAGSYSEAADVL